ncbi:phage late control D family protein [Chitinimonas koreensis]|uniref:phage late control D family protein n=1 Tax=Chitinimonas koreensis TaxID=356302 RepID=UPI000406537D|nr:phage late control D family protein [Chitinimonas koreensis]QNM96402.1 phage late control D family protein [Chitinimonas koreensis]
MTDTRPRIPPAPVFRLTLGGKDITADFATRLEQLTLTDNRGFDADALEVTLSDHDGRLDIPPRGAQLALSLGWAGGAMVDKGLYTVDEVEHSGTPDKLTLRARSADLRAGLTTKKERSWHRRTVGDIVRTIAGEAGLEPAIGAGLAAQAIDHVDQTAESDINLLTRLARMFDAIATVKGGRLLFTKAGSATSASGQPLAAVTITRAAGDSHRFSVADRETYTAVRAYYQDMRAAKKGEVLVDGTAPTAGKKGKKRDKRTAPSADNVKTLRHTYANKANAERAARAEWDKLQRGVATFALTLAHGRPELTPELPATVSGFKPAINDLPWIIAKVVHTLGDSGLTTQLDLEVRAEQVE